MSNDGNTAFQVSPTEDEAMSLADIFRKAADAVVNASQFKAALDTMRSEFEHLKAELDNSRMHSQELDQTIHELREQRDAARYSAAELERERDSIKKDRDSYFSECERLVTSLDKVCIERDDARTERDDAQLRVLELEEQLATAHSTADKLRETLRGALDLVAEPEPPPEPETSSHVVSMPEPEAATPSDARVVIEMPPVQPEPTLYPEWAEGRTWDNVRNGWVDAKPDDEIPF